MVTFLFLWGAFEMQKESVSPDVQISRTIEVRLNTPPGLPAKIFEGWLRGGNAS